MLIDSEKLMDAFREYSYQKLVNRNETLPLIEINSIIRKQTDAGQWRTDKPKSPGDYLTTVETDYGHRATEITTYANNQWCIGVINEKVIAWKDKPDPYKVLKDNG